MKHKLKNIMQQAELTTSEKILLPIQRPSWEMSAQDALRVDYVSPRRSLPAYSNDSFNNLYN